MSNASTSESGSTSTSTASGSTSTSTFSSSSTSGSTSGSLNTSAASSTVNSMNSTTLGDNAKLAGAATLTVNGQTIQEGKGQKLTAKQLANLFGTSLVQKQQVETVTSKDNGGVDVSTVAEFQKAIKDKNVTNINLVGNIDFSSYNYGDLTINHSLNINANGYKMYFNGSKAGSKYVNNANNNIAISNSTANTTTEVTVKNADIYTSASYGAFRPLANAGNTNLVLQDTNITGGTAVRSETIGNGQNKVTIKGTVNITATKSYQAENGATVDTHFWANPNDGKGTSQIYSANGVVVSDGATLNMNANGLTAYNVDARDNIHAYEFTVGNNATVNMEGSTTGNVILNQPIAGNAWNQGNSFTVGDNSNVNMKSSNFNVLMDNGGTSIKYENNVTIGKSNVNLTIDGSNNSRSEQDANIMAFGSDYYTVNGGERAASTGSSSRFTMNINEGATLTATTYGDASNISTNQANAIISIDNPNVVTFNKGTGYVYNSTADELNIHVKVNASNIEVTEAGNTTKSAILIDSYADYSHSHDYYAHNGGIISGVYIGKNDDVATDLQIAKQQRLANDLFNDVNNREVTKVVYNGKTTIESESTSTSKSVSQSQSTEDSTSKSKADSESNASKSTSESKTSESKSIADSESNSKSISEQNSTSKSISDSESNASKSKSESKSIADSVSNSKAISESESISKSNSEKTSESTSKSEEDSKSNSNSKSISESQEASASQSLSTSVSDSTSRSLSDSLSSSLSTSLSTSHSAAASTSVENSHSASNGDNSTSESHASLSDGSKSESESISVSASESLSASLSASNGNDSTSESHAAGSKSESQDGDSKSSSTSASASTSQFISTSTSTSTSNDNPASRSLSISASESQSASESIQQSASLSESLSNASSISGSNGGQTSTSINGGKNNGNQGNNGNNAGNAGNNGAANNGNGVINTGNAGFTGNGGLTNLGYGTGAGQTASSLDFSAAGLAGNGATGAGAGNGAAASQKGHMRLPQTGNAGNAQMLADLGFISAMFALLGIAGGKKHKDDNK